MTNELPTPRLSATMIVVREAGGDAPFEVLAITRSKNLRVLPGFMVFPGGVLDDMDLQIATSIVNNLDGGVPALFEVDAADFKGSTLGRERLYASLFAAGARELFEETGIYMGARHAGWIAKTSARADLLRGQGVEWQRAFADESACFPHRYVGRRVTPIQVKFRFDTHFFIVQVPKGTEADPSPDEVESVVWSTPGDLLARFEQDEIRMAPPTVDVLATLERHRTLADLLGSATMPSQVNDDERIGKFLRQLYAN